MVGLVQTWLNPLEFLFPMGQSECCRFSTWCHERLFSVVASVKLMLPSNWCSLWCCCWPTVNVVIDRLLMLSLTCCWCCFRRRRTCCWFPQDAPTTASMLLETPLDRCCCWTWPGRMEEKHARCWNRAYHRSIGPVLTGVGTGPITVLFVIVIEGASRECLEYHVSSL